MKILFQVFFIGHWLTCLWMFVTVVDAPGDLENIRYQTWWLQYLPNSRTHPPNVGDLYIASLYYTFYTMATVGYGDIVATTTAERGVAVILLVVGALVFGYIVGSVSELANTISSEGLRARGKAKVTEVKAYLVSWLACPRMSSYLILCGALFVPENLSGSVRYRRTCASVSCSTTSCTSRARSRWTRTMC